MNLSDNLKRIRKEQLYRKRRDKMAKIAKNDKNRYGFNGMYYIK